MKELVLPAAEILKNVEVKVTVSGMTRLQLRILLGGWLIRLAAWVMGCKSIDLELK